MLSSCTTNGTQVVCVQSQSINSQMSINAKQFYTL